jgi:hypothetical protein
MNRRGRTRFFCAAPKKRDCVFARVRYGRVMRRLSCLLVLVAVAAWSPAASAASGRVIKVLPHFLDQRGRHTPSPSLYDRDAYQAQLRRHPEQRAGMRFDVQWKGRSDSGQPLQLRVELRGLARGELPATHVLEKVVAARTTWSRWTHLSFTGAAYQEFGEVTAWRVTLLEGEQVLGQQQSFLW